MCVQTSNSINQNPCEVAAYLQSTCSQGSECFSFFQIPRPALYENDCITSSSLPAFTVPALPVGFQYSGPTAQGGDDLCKCNTVTYSLLSACGGCQEDLWISYVLRLFFFLHLLVDLLVYEPVIFLIDGLNGYPTARRFCPLRREFPPSRSKKKNIQGNHPY